jgi:hypothetical protein
MVKKGKPVPEDFVYTSDLNSQWMAVEELRQWVEKNLVNKPAGVAPSPLD